jgi:hypothetical protein
MTVSCIPGLKDLFYRSNDFATSHALVTGIQPPMADRKKWHISTWHGDYELESGPAPALSGRDQSTKTTTDHDRLFFLINSFMRRDPNVMPALLDVYASTTNHTFQPIPSPADIPTPDLERIADELRFRAG